ncbi:hypothetical protein Tco_0400563, partial [Tanacetum coccineum]
FKIATAREKKDWQNLAKAQAKRAREGNSEVTRKNRRVRKDQDLDRSGSIRVLSTALLHHGAPENAGDPPHVVQDDATGDTTNIEREVVDLSRNNHVATSPATVNQPLPRLDHHNTQEHTALDAKSFHSTHHEDTEEEAADSCKELVSNLATLAEEEFLVNLTNVKVVSRTYQLLGQCVLSQAGPFEDGSPKGDIGPEWIVKSARGLEEREKVLEGEKVAIQAKTDQAEKDRHRLVREFIPAVVKRLHTSVEYRQSLAAPVSLCFTAGWFGGFSLGQTEDDIARMLSETRDLDIEGSKSWEVKHRELFTMQYPYVQKVAASYQLHMDDLMKIIPDVPPPPPPEDEVETSDANDTADVLQKSPLAIQETTVDTPFGTTT